MANNRFRAQDGIDVGDGKFVVDPVGDNINVTIPVTFTGQVTFEGTRTEIDTTVLLVEDKNIELGVVDVPDDTTANAGGITLKGTTDKIIEWLDGNNAWNFNQDINLSSDSLDFNINDAQVLSKTTLGPTVVNSSLTSFGVLTSLEVDGIATFNEAWSIESIDFTATLNNKYFIDTNSSPIVVTVPTTDLSIGQTLEISDIYENFHMNSATLQGPSGLGFTFEGNTDTVLVLDVQNAYVKLVYTGDPAFGWKRID